MPPVGARSPSAQRRNNRKTTDPAYCCARSSNKPTDCGTRERRLSAPGFRRSPALSQLATSPICHFHHPRLAVRAEGPPLLVHAFPGDWCSTPPPICPGYDSGWRSPWGSSPDLVSERPTPFQEGRAILISGLTCRFASFHSHGYAAVNCANDG